MSELLAIPPFSGWAVTRSIEEDLPKKEVCDEAERIRTIFLRGGDGEALSEVSFSLGRREVRERYGSPSKSGGPVRIPALGDRGAWDTFTLPAVSIHVQYRVDRDEIDMITLMSPDAVPNEGGG